jgi:hypothetical protein
VFDAEYGAHNAHWIVPRELPDWEGLPARGSSDAPVELATT